MRFPALLEQPPVDRVRKRGLVYPKLAQSKGSTSGDRMNSPDLFWGSRRVSAALPGPDPREAVPRGRSNSSPKARSSRCPEFSQYVGGGRYGASNHVIWTRRLDDSDLLGVAHIAFALWVRCEAADAPPTRTACSAFLLRPTFRTFRRHARFPSCSSGPSSSGRDSENFFARNCDVLNF